MSFFCEQCGNPVSAEQKFCTKCGNPLTPAEPAAPAQPVPAPSAPEAAPAPAAKPNKVKEYFASAKQNPKKLIVPGVIAH